MNLKEYVIDVVVNFCIWMLPFVIITEILLGYMWIGGLMGIFVMYAFGPNYVFRISHYYNKPFKKR